MAAERPGPETLFAPASVAIFGASDSPASFGERALLNLERSGFEGEVVPVNPRRAGTEVLGHRCYGSLEEYGRPVEQAMIMLKAADTVPLLEECGRAGVRAASLVAGGFAEAGAEGRELQARVAATADRYGMRLLGPNCLGFCNLEAKVCLSPGSIFESVWPSGGPLAIVSQSGALAADIMAATETAGLGVSFWASTGNEIEMNLAGAVAYAAGIEPVRAIAVYCEELRDVPRFVEAVSAAGRRGVAVAVLRSGTTAAGAGAVASHTASLVTGEELYASIFRESGAIPARSLRELVDCVRVACTEPAAAAGVAIVSSSGGSGALAADAASERGVGLAEISEPTKRELRELVPFASVGNPLDVTGITNSDPTVFRKFIEAVQAEDSVGTLVVIHGSGMLWRDRGEIIAEALAEVAKGRDAGEGGAIYFVGMAPDRAGEIFRKAGIPVFGDVVDLVRAIAAVQASRGIVADEPAPPARPSRALAEGTVVLREDRGLDLLEAELGVPTVARGVVSDRQGAMEAASRLGFPVVVKALVPGLTHKVSAGAVHLGLADEAAVGAVWPEVERVAAEHGSEPLALVEAMVAGASGEVFLSAFEDPVLGAFLAIGRGGGEVEEAAAIRFCPAPVTAERAERLVRELDLSGNGRPARVPDGLAAQLAEIAGRLSRAPGSTLPAPAGTGLDEEPGSSATIQQVEVNPLLIGEDGCVAVDVVMGVAR